MADVAGDKSEAAASSEKASKHHSIDGPHGWLRFFNAKFYLSKNPDVASAGLDAAEHFENFGWQELRNPNPWFSTGEYLERFPALKNGTINPLVHFATQFDSGQNWAFEMAEAFRLMPSELIASDQLDDTLAMRIPTRGEQELVAPYFDETFYVAKYPDVATSEMDPLVHYMMVGWLRNFDPSPEFSTRYYLKHNSDVRKSAMNPLLHYAQANTAEKRRRAVTVADGEILDKFTDGVLAEHVKEAVEIDPMVALPLNDRRITTARYFGKPMHVAAQRLRRNFAGRSFQYAIVMGQVRMSGAAKVAGKLATSYAELYGAENVVVITTDRSDFEYPEWFPGDVEVIVLSSMIEDVDDAYSRQCLLLDLLQGIEVEHIANVNSRLMWDTLLTFGRQIAQEFFVASYLFCWDETPEGSRVGYPIQWINDTIDHHDLILCDADYLSNHLRERFALGADKVATLPTPMPPLMHAGATLGARTGRVLWAGRFDPQKRLDVLIAIARAHPELEIHAYGKPVLTEKGLEDFDPPANIVVHEAFSDPAEVLPKGFDFFLYTAQWDGLPSVLLEMGQIGLPIVAPDVGGIGELITDQTGWLVEKFDDVDAFSKTIRALFADLDAATRKAATLKALVASEYNEETYRQALQKVLPS